MKKTNWGPIFFDIITITVMLLILAMVVNTLSKATEKENIIGKTISEKEFCENKNGTYDYYHNSFLVYRDTCIIERERFEIIKINNEFSLVKT